LHLNHFFHLSIARDNKKNGIGSMEYGQEKRDTTRWWLG
jgi:hypothetical protein